MLLEVAPLIGGTEALVTESEQWVSKEQGGWHEGTFTVRDLPEHLRAELSGAAVTLHGQSRPAFMGRVLQASGNTLRCQGWYQDLNESEAGGVYSTAAVTDWREIQQTNRDTNIQTQNEVGILRFLWTKGNAYGANAYQGVVLDLPQSATVARLSFDYARYNQSDYAVKVYTGVYDPASTSGDSYTFTERYSQPTTSGGTTGAITLDLTSYGAFDAVLILALNAVSVTPGADTAYTITNLRYTSGGLTAPVTADALLGELLDTMPAPPTLRELTATSDDITDFRLDAGASALEATSKLLAMGDSLFAFKPRIRGGAWEPGAVFAPRPTVPAYSVTHDGTSVIAEIEPVDWSRMASSVRVRYRTLDGRSVSLVVTDTDPTHYLVARGRVKPVSIDVDTTSATVAQAAGEAYLAAVAGVEPVSGTVTIVGNAAGIPHTDIEPGELITVAIPGRTVTARIREVAYSGSKAVLTLNNTPTLEDVLRGVRA